MAKRTVRQGAIRSKQQKAKGQKVSSVWPYKKYRKLTFEQAREEGVIEPRKFRKNELGEPVLEQNPDKLGQGDYFFRKRRKVNWQTRKKFGPTGRDYYGREHPRAQKWIQKVKEKG